MDIKDIPKKDLPKMIAEKVSEILYIKKIPFQRINTGFTENEETFIIVITNWKNETFDFTGNYERIKDFEFELSVAALAQNIIEHYII